MADPKKKLTKVPLGPTGVTVATNLARLMETLNIKPTELSKKLEQSGRRIPVLGVRSILAQERRVDVDDLLGLCAALGVQPTALLNPEATSGGQTVEVTGIGEVSAEVAYSWFLGTPLPGNPNYYMSLVLSTPVWEVAQWPTDSVKRVELLRLADGDDQ